MCKGLETLPPSPPSCSSGQEYCLSGDGTGHKACYSKCKNSKNMLLIVNVVLIILINVLEV